MDVERGRDWGRRDTVIATGVVAAVVFILIALTGSDVDNEAARTLGTATTVVLFTALGSVGVALAHWRRRFALFGAITVTLSLTCVLLGLVRPGDDGRTQLVQVAAIGSLALLVALAILTVAIPDIDLGARVYAILATVYVVATAVLLVLRLLPTREETLVS